MVESTEAVFASGVARSFPGGVRALEAVDFAVQFGQIVGLIGANGSGKTTLLRILFGILFPDAGTVRTLGCDPAKNHKRLCAQAAYVPQQQSLDPEMTGREMLLLFSTLYGLSGAERRKRVEVLTALFGLGDVASRRASTYSGGLRQRLHLALGMVHAPRVLLLDEPTNGLDPQGRGFAWQTFRELAQQGCAVVVITHDLDEVYRRCDRLALLSHGQVRAAGAPHDIVAQHGRIMLEVTLTNPPDSDDAMWRQLSEMDGVEGIELRGRQFGLQLRGGPGAEDRVLDWIKARQLEVTAYRCERPSLSSAYFHLTGQRLASDARQPRQRQRKERL